MDLSREVFRREMIPVVGWILFYSSKVLVINHMCAMASIEASKIFTRPYIFSCFGINKEHKFF